MRRNTKPLDLAVCVRADLGFRPSRSDLKSCMLRTITVAVIYIIVFLCGMTVFRALFAQDKNYILKEVQSDTKDVLLERLAQKVRNSYLSRCNPLGLEDDTIKTIKHCTKFTLEHLDTFYWELAGVFRYRIGSNQLEFIFSGKSHYDKYLDDWCDAFDIWLEDFILSPYFIRAVLEMTILQPEGRAALLAKDRMKVYLSQYFNLKVYKFRGIVPIAAA